MSIQPMRRRAFIATRVAILGNNTNPFLDTAMQRIRPEASTMGIALELFEVRNKDDVDGALVRLDQARPDAVQIVADTLLLSSPSCAAPSSASQRLIEIGNQIIGMLDTDRQADQGGRDAETHLFLTRDVGMRHRRGVRGQSLGAAEAYRELDHFQPVENGKRLCLAAFDFEAERRARPLALAFENCAIGMGLR